MELSCRWSHSHQDEERRLASGEGGRTLHVADWRRNEDEKKMSAALQNLVAKEVGTEYITAVAIAYVMQKTPCVFAIIGGRKVDHLLANIEALKVSLSDDQIKYIESILSSALESLFGSVMELRIAARPCCDLGPLAAERG